MRSGGTVKEAIGAMLGVLGQRAESVEALEGRVLLAGVSVVTHGYQLSGNVPAWVGTMAGAIADRAGPAGSASRAGLVVSGDGSQMSWQGATGMLSATRRGEAVIALDWAAASNNGISDLFNPTFVPTTQIAGQLVQKLLSTSVSGLTTSALAELPIYLTGHSRGGSLVAAAAQILAGYGIWVDQVAMLDQHPVNPDPSPTIYSNTLFADNYFHTDSNSVLDPDGFPVANTRNVDLTGHLGSGGTQHSKVHAYYYGTINTTATSDGDGITIDPAWYNAPLGPRDAFGFAYSRLGGLDQRDASFSAGLLAALGGTAVRPTLAPTPGVAQWPNVAAVRTSVTGAVTQASKFDVSFAYGDRDSSETLTFYLDTDDNPYNGTGPTLGARTYRSALMETSGVTLSVSNAAPGTYYIGVRASDATHRRFAYSTTTLTVVAPRPMPPGNADGEVTDPLPALGAPKGAGSGVGTAWLTLATGDAGLGGSIVRADVAGAGGVTVVIPGGVGIVAGLCLPSGTVARAEPAPGFGATWLTGLSLPGEVLPGGVTV